MDIVALLATFFSTVFFGASVYINAVEHPARMECGTELAATVFGPSYRRASAMQVSLALVSTVAALIAWYFSGEVFWALGAALMVAVIPFTLVAIMPTNKLLLSADLDKADEATRELLNHWGKLHTIRSLLSLASSLLFLYLLARA